ncbi:aminotransferase class III-fold pyridoxal phosphate-dependent enzyme [Streptomyces sp. NPDC086081]|uniref:aminotransferase class III-fold pyridoxal phosphate-dependent enzyme n=1 Tax=Streptomyces sp. NPDC086081 TaxID=3365749 RepID=UPI0037F1F932
MDGARSEVGGPGSEVTGSAPRGGIPALDDGVPGGRIAREGFPRRQTVREAAARTYARALPIVPVRARGMTIEGADGRRYLDCLSGAGALALGHNHPVVLEAIRKVLDSGAPLNSLDLATPVKDAFVTELFHTLPRRLADRARVRFCGPTGSDALRTAVALVRAATGCHDLDGRDTGVVHLAYPQDRPDLFRADADALPAGVIVEPVQGEGGVFPTPDGWLRRVRQATSDRSVPLIADEIQTGVGRTGTFWAVEHSGVTPDVMVLSEAIGGSLPLAVVVYRDDLDSGEPAPQTGTFRGNQLAMAAGTATLAHVRENLLAERASDLGARMLDQLRSLLREFACVGDVRGRGLMIGVELVDPAGESEPGPPGTEEHPMAEEPPPAEQPAARDLSAMVQQECLRRGLIVGLGGRHANVVRLLPPLTITDEQAAAVLDRLTDAIRAAARCHQGMKTPRWGLTSASRRMP